MKYKSYLMLFIKITPSIYVLVVGVAAAIIIHKGAANFTENSYISYIYLR